MGSGGSFTQAGGATGELIGGGIGMLLAQKNYDEIARLRKEALERYGKIDLPTLEKVYAEVQGPSKYNAVTADPRYKSAGDEALSRMLEISRAGGMDARAKARLADVKGKAMATQRGMEGAALTGLARRGALDSGAQVTAATTSAQRGVDRAYQGDLQTAADAEDRALQAISSAGGMARGMSAADLAQKNLAAGADDRIAQFNIGNKLGTAKFNRGLENQRFTNAMGKAGAMNQRSDVMADDQFYAADKTQRTARAAGKGNGAVIGSGADYLMDMYGGGMMGG